MTVMTTRSVRPPRPGGRENGSRLETRLLLWPPVLFFLVALGLPIAALVHQALSGGGNAFIEALGMDTFVQAAGRTLLMAAIVTVITGVFAVVYAIAVIASPTWLRLALVAWLFLSLWTSVMVRSFGWMLLELPRGALFWLGDLLGLSSEPLNIYQTAFAMYPAMAAMMLPFAVLPILNALTAIDREQLRAAAVFGAGPWLTMRAVILPAIRPAAWTGGTLVFVMALGFYVTPLLLGGPTNMTISGLISTQVNVVNRPDLAAAMSLLLVAATVLIYLVADKLFKVSEKWG